MTTSQPRGVRNHNPGNIERNATKWQGMADDQSSDPRFIVFAEARYGIRALARTLLTYQSKYGLDTVREIINRWAPPIENDTGAYVNAVAKSCKVAPDQKIDLDSVDVMLPLVRAIIRHENGGNPYDDAEILEGLHLAGIADAPAPKPQVVIVEPEPLPPPKPEKPVETHQSPIKSKTIWGAQICAILAPLVVAVGPAFFQNVLKVDPAGAQEATNAIVTLLCVLGGNVATIGRGSATIKPLG